MAGLVPAIPILNRDRRAKPRAKPGDDSIGGEPEQASPLSHADPVQRRAGMLLHAPAQLRHQGPSSTPTPHRSGPLPASSTGAAGLERSELV
jgi:hypothetical protein